MGAKAAAEARTPRLQGPERVAALLLAMGKPLAERLLPHFEPEELGRISRAAAGLGAVPAAEIETLIEEFAAQFSAGLNLLVSAREMESLLSGVIPPEQIAQLMAEPRPAAEPPVWERVSRLPEAALSAYLLKERPQTIALLLSKIEATPAAKLLRSFPPELRLEVTRRMLASKPPTEAALRVVSGALNEDLLAKPAGPAAPDMHERLARIINQLDRDEMEGVLEGLGEARPGSVAILKGMLFTFEDLPELAPDARSALLDRVPNDQLVLALRGAEAALCEAALSSLAPRARRMVESELARSDSVPQKEVAEARRRIAELALEMAGRGEIAIRAGEAEAAVS